MRWEPCQFREAEPVAERLASLQRRRIAQAVILSAAKDLGTGAAAAQSDFSRELLVGSITALRTEVLRCAQDDGRGVAVSNRRRCAAPAHWDFRSTHCRPSVRRSAFTLIEVLATLLLLAIVIPVAMQAISLASGTASVARHRAEAAGLAEGKMAELIATGDWQTSGLQGDFGELYPDYQWFAQVSNWTEADVMQLDVSVSWTSARRGEESVVVSTLVYGAATADPADSTGTTGTGGTTP